jgi:hypothetical protein
MGAGLQNELSTWFAQLAEVPGTHPIATVLIGLAWAGCLLARSMFAACMATLLAALALMLLTPGQSEVARWAMLGVLLVADAVIVLHIWAWRSRMTRELGSVSAELDRVQRAYDGEVHWRMAAYREEAARLATGDMPLADLNDRVEKLVRQLDASRVEPGDSPQQEPAMLPAPARSSGALGSDALGPDALGSGALALVARQ